MSLLSASNLSIGYKRPLITDVSFDLEEGQLVALVGRNGCGKTTLIRTVLGVEKPLGGNITVGGKELGELSRHDLARSVSAVLTTSVQAGGLLVSEIVELGRQPYAGIFGKLDEENMHKVDNAMQVLKITSLANKRFGEISDGERQKVMIARAFAQDTSVILMDEPLAFLDYPSKLEVLQILRNLANDQNKSIVFSAHELNLIPKISDEVWMIDQNNKWQVFEQDIEEELTRNFGQL